MQSILLIGGRGQVGSELREAFSDLRVEAPTSAELPFENEAALGAALDRVRPDVLINCCAFHRLDLCEADPRRAFEINALAVGMAAKLTRERGVRFVTLSTDYVFDGEATHAYVETERESPLNVYGVSKVAGERSAFNENANTIVFRLSGVFGKSGFSDKGPTFVERMIAAAEAGEPIKVVDNVRFSPSYAPDVAKTMRAVIEGETSGLFHLTNAGDCSWYDLAVESLRAAGLHAEIERTKYSNEGSAIKRPMHSPLAHAELHRRGYPSPRLWQAAVAEYAALRARRVQEKSAANAGLA
jgi:dTDP-4-dehydrorhamnose reductase